MIWSCGLDLGAELMKHVHAALFTGNNLLVYNSGSDWHIGKIFG